MRIWTSNLSEPKVEMMRNTNPHMDYSLRTMMREANATSTIVPRLMCSSYWVSICQSWIQHSPHSAKGFPWGSLRLFPILIFSISYSIFHQVWHILPPKYSSHLIPVSLFYFQSLSFTWPLQCILIVLFLLISHPFSVLPIRMIQKKCPSPRFLSRSAFGPASNLY